MFSGRIPPPAQVDTLKNAEFSLWVHSAAIDWLAAYHTPLTGCLIDIIFCILTIKSHLLTFLQLLPDFLTIQSLQFRLFSNINNKRAILGIFNPVKLLKRHTV
jgi:hypothetical protein